MLIPIDVLLTFFTAAVLLALSPGPDNLFVLAQSSCHGRKAGLAVTLGLCSGLVFHTLAVSLGVAAIFASSALAFTLLKLVGAGYLIYLAYGAFRDAGSVQSLQPAALSSAALYRRGVLMNITNPKVSIFFLAFLPQFTDVARGSLTLQMMLLGAVFMLAALLVFGALALLAGKFGEQLAKKPQNQRWLNRLAGSVFLLLAGRLLVSE